jgi:molecular chaperone IbpA
MTGYDLINSYSKQFFDHGLDTFDKVFDSWSKVSGFPFWNVVKYDKGKYGLEIGLAGYKKSDVLVEVNEGILSVSGKVDDSAVDYVQKNLATREFYKQFQLPNNAVVDEAKMEDGLLKVKFGYKEDDNKQTVEVK